MCIKNGMCLALKVYNCVHVLATVETQINLFCNINGLAYMLKCLFSDINKC